MVILAFFVLIVSWFACGFYCSQVAYEKGYNGTAWAFGGFLFGFIALIAVAGLPDRKLRKYIRQIEGEKNSKEPQSDGDWAKKPASWDNVSKLDK